MGERPSLDDLKLARDGRLSAGGGPPICASCGEPIASGFEQARAVLCGVKHVEADGRRFTVKDYRHAGCPTSKEES